MLSPGKRSITTVGRAPAGHVRVTVTAMVVAVGLCGPIDPASAATRTVDTPIAASSLRVVSPVSTAAGVVKTAREAHATSALPLDDETEGEPAGCRVQAGVAFVRSPRSASAG